MSTRLVGLGSEDWSNADDSVCGFAPRGLLRRIGGSPRLHRAIRSALQVGNVQLVHVHSVWWMPVLYASREARCRDIPLVVAPRGTLLPFAFRSGALAKRLSWHLCQRRAVLRARCFHATSEEERRQLRKLGVRQPIAVIPNGIDVSTAPRARPHQRRVILFLGRIHEIKGVDQLLAAWELLATEYPDWELEIAGPWNTPFGRQLRTSAAIRGIPKLRWLGEVTGQPKADSLSRASLVVLPSHSENFGVVVAEALSSGIPVVVSSGTPWGRVAELGCGWSYPVGFSGLVHSLRTAMRQPPEVLTAMGLQGWHWMSAEFNWKSVAERMCHMYNFVIHGGDVPAFIEV